MSHATFALNLITTQNSMMQANQGEAWGGFVFYILTIIALWPVFVKGGYPGWGAIIPIYNVYVLTKLAGYHGATILLYLIPIFNIIWGIVISLGLAKAFGKGGAFGFFMLWLLSLIGYFILGYGRAQFVGRHGEGPRVRTV